MCAESPSIYLCLLPGAHSSFGLPYPHHLQIFSDFNHCLPQIPQFPSTAALTHQGGASYGLMLSRCEFCLSAVLIVGTSSLVCEDAVMRKKRRPCFHTVFSRPWYVVRPTGECPPQRTVLLGL